MLFARRFKYHQLVYLVAIIGVFVNLTDELKTGAPDDAVHNMMPHHGGAPQPLPSPYNITTNRWKLRPGCIASIYIKSKNESIPFKGFLVTAKDNVNVTVGTFLAEEEDYKLLSYGNGSNNAATHLNNTDKTTMTLYWKAPPILRGPIRFSMTIVKDKETYWVGEETEEMVVHR